MSPGHFATQEVGGVCTWIKQNNYAEVMILEISGRRHHSITLYRKFSQVLWRKISRYHLHHLLGLVVSILIFLQHCRSRWFYLSLSCDYPFLYCFGNKIVPPNTRPSELSLFISTVSTNPLFWWRKTQELIKMDKKIRDRYRESTWTCAYK